MVKGEIFDLVTDCRAFQNWGQNFVFGWWLCVNWMQILIYIICLHERGRTWVFINTTFAEDHSTGPTVQMSVEHLATRQRQKNLWISTFQFPFHHAFCVSNVTYRWPPSCLLEASNNNLWLMILYNQSLCALTHTCVQVPLPFDEYNNWASS